MTTSVNCGYPLWLDGMTFNGQLGRQAHILSTVMGSGTSTALAPHGGAFIAPGSPGTVTAPGGMSVGVNAGTFVVPSSTSGQGAYMFSLVSSTTLDVATADPSNPRIDLVVAVINDNGDDTSDCEIDILTGTPTAGATLSNLTGGPAAPTNSLDLGWVLVPAGATAVVSGDLANALGNTTAPGGILPVSAAFAPTGYNGAIIWDKTSGRLIHNSAAGLAQIHLMPFASVDKSTTTSVSTASTATVLSGTITTDGVTDIMISVQWAGTSAIAGGAYRGEHQLFIDSTQVASCWVDATFADGNLRNGGTLTHYTSSASGDTPSAATHTIAWKFNAQNGGSAVTVSAAAGKPATMHVQPVCL